MAKSFHVHIDVKEMLTHSDAGLRPFRKAFVVEGVRTSTVTEVRQILVETLANGTLFLPAGQPCEGWSYQTGCPGHEREEVAHG